MQKYIQVTTTVNKKRIAKDIAKKLIEQKIAACVQIIPLRSIYRWNNNIEHKKEFMLIIKGNDFKKIGKAIKELHPYEIPEIIATPITAANKEYLDWIDKETQ
jgi:periplasmic divalent cation tolerance protein